MSKSKLSSGPSDLDHLELIPYRPHRSWLVQLLLLLWRWAVELVLLVLVTVLVVKVHQVTGLSGLPCVVATIVLLAWVTGVYYVLPFTRNFVPGMFWCLVTRHRLRTFFVQARIYNRSQRLPWILLVRPTVVGERAWVWLVPGLSVDDFTGSTEKLTAATWSRTARIERSRQYGSLVRVDIVRRDPLMAIESLPSVLIPASQRGESARQDNATVEPLSIPRMVVDLTTGTGDGAVTAKRNGVNKSLTPKGKAALSSHDGAAIPGPRLVSHGGEDVSDYV